MLQYDLVNLLLDTFVKSGLVEACYLKGSLARKTEDKYSNVDFYCVVNQTNKITFLKKRLRYLQVFNPIKHYFEINISIPKIICIYDNGIIINLYTLMEEEITDDEEIMAIYDPHEILSGYQNKSLDLTANEFGAIINEFSLNCLYFHKAYLRGNIFLALHYANILHGYYLRLIHYYENKERAKLGLRDIEKHLSPEKAKEIIALTKLIKYETILIGVKTITVAMQEAIVNLPISETMYIDYDFFLYAKKEIFSIEEE